MAGRPLTPRARSRRPRGGRGAAPTRPRFRQAPRAADPAAVRALAESTGVFTAEECGVAAELVEERLRRGRRAGYSFSFATAAGVLVGYTAFGPIPMTADSFDLYWIVVDPTHQGRGLGRELLGRVEAAVRSRGGRRLYIETSSRDRYARTRRFYRRAGYRQAARLESFYAPGDHKLVFCKILIQKT